MKSNWQKWKKIAAKIANFQADTLLSIVFIVVIIPVHYFRSLINFKNFKIKHVSDSFWSKKDKQNQNISWAKKQ